MFHATTTAKWVCSISHVFPAASSSQALRLNGARRTTSGGQCTRSDPPRQRRLRAELRVVQHRRQAGQSGRFGGLARVWRMIRETRDVVMDIMTIYQDLPSIPFLSSDLEASWSFCSTHSSDSLRVWMVEGKMLIHHLLTFCRMDSAAGLRTLQRSKAPCSGRSDPPDLPTWRLRRLCGAWEVQVIQVV